MGLVARTPRFLWAPNTKMRGSTRLRSSWKWTWTSEFWTEQQATEEQQEDDKNWKEKVATMWVCGGAEAQQEEEEPQKDPRRRCCKRGTRSWKVTWNTTSRSMNRWNKRNRMRERKLHEVHTLWFGLSGAGKTFFADMELTFKLGDHHQDVRMGQMHRAGDTIPSHDTVHFSNDVWASRNPAKPKSDVWPQDNRKGVSHRARALHSLSLGWSRVGYGVRGLQWEEHRLHASHFRIEKLVLLKHDQETDDIKKTIMTRQHRHDRKLAKHPQWAALLHVPRRHQL